MFSVNFILFFKKNKQISFFKGVNDLILLGAFKDAFPIHDNIDKIRNFSEIEHKTTGQYLHKWWATLRYFYKKQPINLIQKYFGDKVAFYFGWLEFYTLMLVPAAIVGLIVTISGFYMRNSSDIVKLVCEDKFMGSLKMCPTCKEKCAIKNLSEECSSIKNSRIIDNYMTVFYSIFICIWSVFLTQIWRRYEYTYAFEWDSIDYEKYASLLRPKIVTDSLTEFNRKVKYNPFTGVNEPYVSIIEKVTRMSLSITVIIFMIMLSIAGFLSNFFSFFYSSTIFFIIVLRHTNNSNVFT